MSIYGKSRVYYFDHSSWNGSRDDLPKTGIIAINQIVDGFRRTLCGADFYWLMPEDEWCCGDRHGCDMYLMEKGIKTVFFGVNINTHIYKRIMRAVHDDPDFPRVKC